MQRGDISNTIAPRLLIVFEGLLGTIDHRSPPPKRFRRLRTHDHVFAHQVNDVVARHVWDLAWRRSIVVEAVTYLGTEDTREDYRREVVVWIDAHDLPISAVRATTPGALARALAYSPAVMGVCDASRSRMLTYGAKGRLVDPESPDFIS